MSHLRESPYLENTHIFAQFSLSTEIFFYIFKGFYYYFFSYTCLNLNLILTFRLSYVIIQ